MQAAGQGGLGAASHPELEATRAEPLTLRGELRRKALHMLPGILPFVFSSIPHRDPLSPLARDIVILSAVALTLLVLLSRARIGRLGESDWIARVLSYPATVLAAVLLFPAQPEFAAVVVVTLAFGDGAATLGGILLLSRPLPWNPAKSWSGFLAFLLCAGPLAVIAYWREAQPAAPLTEAAACGAAAVLVGAIVESAPSRLNDNLRVGVGALVAVALTHMLVSGRI